MHVKESIQWQAVLAHDARLDGHFVYAVRSTRVYCRPSCPARRPNRDRVVFFQTPHQAEVAGYRACRRCRPAETDRGNGDMEMVRHACDYIDSHSDSLIPLPDLASAAGADPTRLRRAFKRITGITPRQYADAQRVRAVRSHLRNGASISNAMYDSGYTSSSRLYERAPAKLGMTPATFRRGAEGVRIDYTITDSSLGRLLVAATERGICAVSLADSDAELRKVLAHEFPAAEIVRRDGSETLAVAVRALASHLRGELPHMDLPLDIRATAFQQRVWLALQAIPYGKTRSYSDVARSLGQPLAARAVARACATNPVPLLVPCHRVVREDGSLGGYGLGLHRKRALLESERLRAG